MVAMNTNPFVPTAAELAGEEPALSEKDNTFKRQASLLTACRASRTNHQQNPQKTLWSTTTRQQPLTPQTSTLTLRINRTAPTRSFLKRTRAQSTRLNIF